MAREHTVLSDKILNTIMKEVGSTPSLEKMSSVMGQIDAVILTILSTVRNDNVVAANDLMRSHTINMNRYWSL